MPDGSSASPRPRFRLAIVGGGIAGLTLAVTLGHYEAATSPVQVDLYEAGPEITTVGAGISVWPRTWVVMKHLGLYDELASEAVKSHGQARDGTLRTAFIYRKSDWKREGHEFARVMVPDGSTTMHRAEMVNVLQRHLPAHCNIHTSKRLIGYSEVLTDGSTRYRLEFADGTTAEADAIVGADGVKSKTRAAMYDLTHGRECTYNVKREECERCRLATPRWTGIVTYRYLIPSDELRVINPRHPVLETPALMSYSGKSKHIITYPISHGKYINWVGFVTRPELEGTTYPDRWVSDATREDVVVHYEGWEPEVEQMLQCVDKPTVWAIHAIDNLPFSVYGNVALMGDAVHAMTPHFGAGGGQAIEDAFILGRLLADPRATLARLPAILRVYQDVRLAFSLNVVRKAGQLGKMCEFDWPGLYDGSPITDPASEQELDTTKDKANELGKAIEEFWQWQVTERVEDQWEAAQTRFETTVLDEERPRNSRKWIDVGNGRLGCCIM